MRIIGGSLRHRRLVSFRGATIRPTTDRVREAVFNIITPRITAQRVLDLFAGSGAMGIEAISRGASQATFVDNNAQAIKVIKKNIETLKITDRASIQKINVSAFLKGYSKQDGGFDIIFIDPPYSAGLYKETLELISTEQILLPNGIIVAEAGKRAPIDVTVKGLEIRDTRRYGDSLIYIFTRTDA